jgi:hypothetical protein
MDLGIPLTQIALGIDRLYRKQQTGEGVLDREGLIAVVLTDIAPASLATWDEAEAAIAELEPHLDDIEEPLRRDYVAEMLDSLRGLVATFRGDRMPYAERVRRCLRVDGAPVPPETMDGYRREIDRLLTEMGHGRGPLAERVTAWEKANQVPPDEVPATLRELLNTTRQRTVDKLFPLPEGMLEPVGERNVPYSAYCDYMGRRLRVNLDYVYTRSALKHLACHEGFPGHFVHLAVRQARVQQGEMPPDAALVVTNSASSALFEGIGENGIYFLDWVEGPADALAMTLNRLRSAARVNAALMIHKEGKSLEEARAYLLETCYTTPAWVESRLAFLTHGLRAPFIFAYWYGDMAVDRVWRRVQMSERPAFFRYLYHHMHTPRTLERYWTE